MTQRFITPSMIAKEAVMVLENELVMAKKVYRGYENEFDRAENGYARGDTISIARPTDYQIRDGAVAAIQDINEGKMSLTIDKQKGIDLSITSKDLTLSIGELSERVIRPAMVQIANQIDVDLMALYSSVPQWVGTPGQTINSFSDFYIGVQQLNEFAAPMDDRAAVLSPADQGGLLGAQTAMYITKPAEGAYRRGQLGEIAAVDTYMSQNVPSHTTGSRVGSILVDLSITTNTISYDDVKDTWVQTIHIDALTNATDTVKKGDVFTIAGVYAVNPVTKARLSFLKQFTVTADVTAASNETDLVITPPIIWTGAQKNVDVVGVTDLNNQAVTFVGTASTVYRQNLMFHKNAFALVMVPMIAPPGAAKVARESYKGISVRVTQDYDIINDGNVTRLDVLYGVKCVDGRLATRLSGT